MTNMPAHLSSQVSRLFLRADASSEIGHGHVIRCLSLAEMSEWNEMPVFITSECPEALAKEIQKSCILLSLPKGLSINDEPDYLFKNILKPGDIFILDGYSFHESYQKRIHNGGVRLVYIDDIHQGVQYADIVINHAPGASADLYTKADYTKLCLGIDFLILRKSFRRSGMEGKRLDKIHEAVICFGGADPGNYTLKAFEACIHSNTDMHIHLITGSSYLFKDELHQRTASYPRHTWHENLNAEEMADLLFRVQLVICPASTISLEAFASGNILITGLTADNQLLIFKGLQKFRQVIPIDDFSRITAEEFSHKIRYLLENMPVFDSFEAAKNPYPQIFSTL